MANFDDPVWGQDKLVLWEGYQWENVPGDIGGETFAGITLKDSPDFPGWPIILAAKMKPDFPQNLYRDDSLRQMVHDWYYKNWWCGMLRCQEIKWQRMAFEIYELAVNCGPMASVMIAQRVLNVLNLMGTRWPDIAADGVMGPVTVNILNRALEFPVAYVAQDIVKAFNIEQGHRYIGICEANHGQEKFLDGWLSRVEF